MKIKAAKIRQWHRWLAPIMILPILLTVITGIVFQIGELAGFTDRVAWAIHWHKRDFGFIDFQKSFPFLNGIGLLFLTGTGISMWWKMHGINRSREEK
jgi:phosphotransferase system  glucose/maltose/N-acetylglucosamine-specific IIC component